MTLEQDSLIEYTPTREEELARLTAKAEAYTDRMEAILNDPAIAAFEEAQKHMDKLSKEMAKIQKQNDSLGKEIRAINRPKLDEPQEDGFYILTKSEYGWGKNKEILIEKALLLHTMGEWFDLTNVTSTVDEGRYFKRDKDTFQDVIDISDRTIDISITQLEERSDYPHELLKVTQTGAEDESESTEESDGEDEE